MSSEITIFPADILAVVDGLAPQPPGPDNPIEAAMTLMDARPEPAQLVRVVIYRFDDGPTAEADQYQAALQQGRLPLHGAAAALDCDLQVIELGSGGVNATDNARAAAFGMMAAEQDTGLLAVAGFGAESAARAASCDPARFFATATPETAAIFGAIIAAARAGIPIIVEGAQGRAAVRALRQIRPDTARHVFLCGVDADEAGVHVFGENEPNETGYAAVMLASVLQGEHRRRKAAV
ncbi:MAG: hypothetical protein H6865_07685 [Rhodospirillales bacterium]|nr:hypothetical protein [Alphaproteobacteria bacterium]MCB9987496.1 hypothetical protein [Rhodospirillales bacterium]USO07530.1 MAG: hypothetical protein H6866_08970 [Rhodospirillales bacterium]